MRAAVDMEKYKASQGIRGWLWGGCVPKNFFCSSIPWRPGTGELVHVDIGDWQSVRKDFKV